MIISHRILPGRRKGADEICRENPNTANFCLRKSCRLRDKYEKYCRASWTVIGVTYEHYGVTYEHYGVTYEHYGVTYEHYGVKEMWFAFRVIKTKVQMSTHNI